MQPPLSRLTTTPGQRRWLGGAGLLGVTGATTLLVGWPGLLLGGLLAVSWRWLAPEYTFTGGQFALASSLPAPTVAPLSGLDLLLLSIAEAGLLVLLLVLPADSERPHTTRGLVLVGSAAAVGGLAGWRSVRWLDSLWLPVLGGAILAAAVVAGVHHYEYVTHTTHDHGPDYE